MSTCKKCGRELYPDEIALHKKLVNRGAEDFWCLSCLGEHFKLSEAELRLYAEKFRRYGCTLFGKEPALPPENEN